MNRANRRDRQTRTENRQPRTDRSDRQRGGSDDPITDRTMRDVRHTHPFADRGALNRVFERGTRIAADGGKRDAYDARNPDEEADEECETDEKMGPKRMKDVDHTPPHGEGVERVFERGGKEEPVEAEE